MTGAEQKGEKPFQWLLETGTVLPRHCFSTEDGFTGVDRSLAQILEAKQIRQFLDSQGVWQECHRFFDDWYLYAVPGQREPVYSLFKLREQEFDALDGRPADGDTSGVTVCFIAFDCRRLLSALAEPTGENTRQLNREINRVVAHRGQRHHPALKAYFRRPEAQGAYLVAALYVRHIASFAREGVLPTPPGYQALTRQSKMGRRLIPFLQALNVRAGRTVCDGQVLHLEPVADEAQANAILATHTANTSAHSFAAEVEYHARFLTPLARLRLPFLGRSVYDSAIRADLSLGDGEWQGGAPFYKEDSRLVRRQRSLHSSEEFLKQIRRVYYDNGC